MTLTLTGDRVLIKPEAKKTETDFGLLIPDQQRNKEKPTIGDVVNISSSAKSVLIKTGVKVLFNESAGSEIKIGDEKYLLMRETDVYAIIE